jgi:5-methylcytosine-specific restriction protein A
MKMNDLVVTIRNVIFQLEPIQRSVLDALLVASEQGASAGELRKKCGLKHAVQVNHAVGRIGALVYHSIGRHPDGITAGTFRFWTVIATGRKVASRGFVWSIRQDLVDALHVIGLGESEGRQPGEASENEPHFEGAASQILVDSYERSQSARKECLGAYGVCCVVCNFDFGNVYGDNAKGFIHVHHIKPLADIGERYEVDAIEDLRPVCPNCHAVIHMRSPPHSIDEVKGMIRSNQKIDVSM